MGKDEQGVSIDRFSMIPRTLIFASRDDHILMIKGSPTKRLWPNRYNGIGGHIEKNEDLISAAQREFYEETGMVLTDPWLCGIVTIDTGQDIGICLFVFLGNCFGGNTGYFG
jgi:8-oxo-dGTP diphosphatase